MDEADPAARAADRIIDTWHGAAVDADGGSAHRRTSQGSSRGQGQDAPPSTVPGMTDCLQVSTVTGDRDAAVALLRSAVRAQLAAGGRVTGPTISAWWHHGEYGEGEEWHLQLVTTADRYAALEAHLIAGHPWTSPEVTAVPVTAGSAAYLDWVLQTTQQGR